MLCMVLGLLLRLKERPLVGLGSSWARAPCGVWGWSGLITGRSCQLSCSWLILGMGSDRNYG